ncbi:MAG: F0F1 ATP synthase subunit delta [Sandaracinaceae bacterium]|nr:F0F1 ATP synthase subunit delta [Sandaracinaceae bacterium]
MSNATISRRYAKALLELAEEAKQTPTVHKALAAFAETWATSDTLRDVFENPSVSAESRQKVLDQVATRLAAPPLLKNTLKLLADRGRMALLPELAAAFNGLAQTATGQVEAEVTTASPMPEKYYLELQKVLEKVTGKKVLVVRKQDPSIIAGVITRVGDKVFDGSVRNRLTELKEQLLAQ